MSDDVRDSSLWREVSIVSFAGANPIHFATTATITANKVNYPCLQVLSIDLDRDYVNRYHDAPIMHAVIQKGVFFTNIYPYMDALTCTIRNTPIGEVSQAIDNTQSIQEESFVAILHQQGSPYLENTTTNTPTPTSLDLTSVHEFVVELIPAAAHQARMMAVSPGNLRNVTPEQALRAIMTKESQQLTVPANQAISGVDVIPTNNTTVRDSVSIPHGIMLTDVPNYIHQKCGGLYGAGLGYYLQGTQWYVYPLYDPTRNSQQAPVITIVNLPKNQLVGIERTYATKGGHTTILVTGDVKFTDKSTTTQLNQGSGLRWTDADQLLGGSYIQTADNKAVAFRSKGNFEVMNTPRPDGMNLAPVSGTGATANPYLQYAQLAESNGSKMTFAWNNSDPNLIKPGILVRIMYMNQGQVATLNGVVLRAQHIRRVVGKGFASNRYTTDTGVTIFCQRPMSNGYNAPATTNTTASAGVSKAAASSASGLAGIISVLGSIAGVVKTVSQVKATPASVANTALRTASQVSATTNALSGIIKKL